MGRLDYFLIWSHGLKYKYEIFSIIRRQFPILSIYKRDVGNISKFVRDLYACDTVPFRHLELKTKYLLKLKPDIAIIIVKNEHPDEQIVGTGAFKHKQCMRINKVKAEIRKFNYKEEHVVHASDYESQTDYTLKLLGIAKPQKKKRGVLRTADIDDLKANILGVGLVGIKDTPHYEYVKGHTISYKWYYEKYWGTGLTEDHAPEAFDLLLNNFKYKTPICVDANRIIDGVHRASILKSRGIKNVAVEDIGIQS